ncbi:MAG TPA: phosphatidate cytidylyltransferase [Alphaproteobacteria bacterium]
MKPLLLISNASVALALSPEQPKQENKMLEKIKVLFQEKSAQWGLSPYWNNLSQHQQRWVSALCLILLFTLCVWKGGFLFSVLVMVIALIGYREWLGLVQTVWSPVIEYMAYIGIGLSLVCSAFLAFDLGVFILFLTFLAQLGIAFLYSDKGDQSAPIWIGGGILYIGLPALTILWLRDSAVISLDAPDITMMVILFIIVWATDSFAYWVGKSFGKTPLAPSISPNKTREGLAGGVIGAGVAAAAIGMFLNLPYWPLYFLLGGFVAVVAQVGDLFESWVKRRAGVKDSGQIIPGHGGILDRIDGLLFAAPVYALLIKPFIL